VRNCRCPHPGGAAGALNELAASDDDLVLVLDDYHLVANGMCHATLGFFVDNLPANEHLMVATRVDPPLPRLRASGDLVELRMAEAGFTSAEAATVPRRHILARRTRRRAHGLGDPFDHVFSWSAT
jgi:ATP/maltotriose-dependent transcriptional regulator MalT